MSKLFEPFQQIDSHLTKKQEGTGLGLHLSKNIISMLNGEIKVNSKHGEGTTFTILLPIISKGEING